MRRISRVVMRPQWVVLLFVAPLIVACGESETTVTETTTVETATSAEPPETGTTEEATETGLPSCVEFREASPPEEGHCEVDGTEFVVVNRDSVAKLDELTVRLAAIETTDVIVDLGTTTRPSGTFVIFTLEVKNRLSEPVEFDPEYQVNFTVGRDAQTKTFTADSDGTFEHPESFLRGADEIQPGSTETGTVVFDLPDSAVKGIERSGNVVIANFSDSQRNRARLPLGVIRTYVA